MAKRKANSKRSAEQALNEGLDQLKSARQRIALANKRLLRGQPIRSSEFVGLSDKDYRAMMGLTKRFGVYEPKSSKLTPYRKARVRKAWRQFEELQRGGVFAETKSTKAKAAAKRFGGKANKKGIWFPGSEKEMQVPTGRLKYDKQLGVYKIIVRKRKQDGTYWTEQRYLAGSETLERLKDKLQKRLDRYVGKLAKNQRLKFMIGQNESRRAFRNMHDLFVYAAKYRKDDRARATFLTELTVVVVERRSKRDRKWRKPVGGFRADNYHEVDENVLADFFEEHE